MANAIASGSATMPTITPATTLRQISLRRNSPALWASSSPIMDEQGFHSTMTVARPSESNGPIGHVSIERSPDLAQQREDFVDVLRLRRRALADEGFARLVDEFDDLRDRQYRLVVGVAHVARRRLALRASLEAGAGVEILEKQLVD